MNASGIGRMAIRMLLRRLIKTGVNTGIDSVLGKKKPQGDMTPEERRQAQAGKQSSKRAKQAMKASRRIGKF